MQQNYLKLTVIKSKMKIGIALLYDDQHIQPSAI